MTTIADVAAKFRKLGLELPTELTEEVRGDAEHWLKEQAKQGKSPDGTKWPDKKDGGKALKNAADGISVEARGASLIIKVELPYAYHKKKRNMLPTGKEPEFEKIVRDGAEAIVERAGLS